MAEHQYSIILPPDKHEALKAIKEEKKIPIRGQIDLAIAAWIKENA